MKFSPLRLDSFACRALSLISPSYMDCLLKGRQGSKVATKEKTSEAKQHCYAGALEHAHRTDTKTKHAHKTTNCALRWAPRTQGEGAGNQSSLLKKGRSTGSSIHPSWLRPAWAQFKSCGIAAINHMGWHLIGRDERTVRRTCSIRARRKGRKK